MRNKSDLEEKILETALKLFVRKGYHGTSINDIMAQIGMTKGAFYSHFESKGVLFLMLIQVFKVHFFDNMVADIDALRGNALEKINRIFNFLVKFGTENKDLCVFLTFQSPELNTDIDFEPELRRIYQNYQKFISLLIKQGITEGIFKKELHPDLTALTFMALNDGVFNHWWRLDSSQYIDAEAYIRTFNHIFVSGICSPASFKKECESGNAHLCADFNIEKS
ncbi:TetR/AcrR family transcriptional regulator [Desulfotignum balticum]|uniref:TetR/AcrR family transcriptional regulator n=1 Tax=Desulfotignum balticum TaxID=115781 RepID=UPI000417E59B|nr:TetR/AcrR family transcriptional regulator [Desulfotignum balticum]